MCMCVRVRVCEGKSAPHQWNWENPIQKLTDVSLCRTLICIYRPTLLAPRDMPIHTRACVRVCVCAFLCTVHVCVKDEAGRKPIPDALVR